MDSEINRLRKQLKRLWTLSFVNSGIWALALVCMAALCRDCGVVKGLYPILAGGTCVATIMVTILTKEHRQDV